MSIVELDLQQQVEASSDLELLRAYLRPLVGEQFLKIGFGYGEELHVHFGSSIPLTHPKLRHHTRGSYLLLCSDSDWFLKSATQEKMLTNLDRYSTPTDVENSTANILSEDSLQQAKIPATGSIVLAIRVDHNFGLQMQFSDGTHFNLNPNTNDSPTNESPTLPAWKLMMPSNFNIQAGPDSKWSYLPSNNS